MPEWTFAEKDPAEQLCILHHFSMKKKQDGREIEFVITVKEFGGALKDESMRFLATADKQVNQRTCAVVPVGYGNTLLKALAECMEMIRKFPYEGPA